ncbi:MAG TPA: CPBP family intramembrane glutamic endopeptidase [Candidatus Xenobia bacterium]|nr:CPBP family intramembrane glutamic endopeptidase [Candidatus Xenobia bacterium]
MPLATSDQETPLPSARPLGGLLDLFLFILLAVVLNIGVQLVAVAAHVAVVHQQQPGIPLPQLEQQLREGLQHNAFFLVPVQLAWQVLLLLSLYLILRRIRGVPFWSSLAFRALPAGRLGFGFLLGFLLAPLIQGANLLVPPPEPLMLERLFTTKAASLLILGAAVLVAPFIEELVFRGYIYTLLERLWGGLPAVLISGILFGAIHFVQLWPGWFQMILICVVGIVFSAVRARAGSTLASVAVHFGYNLALALFFLLSPTFRSLPP